MVYKLHANVEYNTSHFIISTCEYVCLIWRPVSHEAVRLHSDLRKIGDAP